MASLSTSAEDSKASTLALEIAKVQNEHDEAQKKADELLVRLNALKIEQKVGRPATKDPEMGKKEASASVGSIKTNLHGQVENGLYVLGCGNTFALQNGGIDKKDEPILLQDLCASDSLLKLTEMLYGIANMEMDCDSRNVMFKGKRDERFFEMSVLDAELVKSDGKGGFVQTETCLYVFAVGGARRVRGGPADTIMIIPNQAKPGYIKGGPTDVLASPVLNPARAFIQSPVLTGQNPAEEDFENNFFL